jgi:hypothetical protein
MQARPHHPRGSDLRALQDTRNGIMTPQISARRAAEDFARVVDGSLQDVADRYADLTSTVDLLRRQDIPVARPEFVADLRSQLMAAADTMLVPVEQTAPSRANVITLQPSRRQRRIATLAAAFVVVGGTAGVAAAAESSLPGDVLYPIKRGIESAQVSLNTSDAARGHDLIAQASTRLDEIDGLMSNGDSTSQITHTLASFKRSATSGADLLFVAYQRDGNPDGLAQLRGTFSDQIAQLKALAAQAPPTAQPDFDSATALLADLDQQARVLCGNCGPDDGASSFVDLSSAPALGSLWTQPAAAAAADQLASEREQLALKAGEIAQHTPQSPLSVTQPDGSTTRDSGSGVSLPSTTAPLKDSAGNVTGGVEGLIDQVGSTTGLTPVTDAVTDTVDQLTTFLLGP